MKPYTYLLINFLTIIICFIFSFHPKIRFYKHFGAFIKASCLVAIPFIIWDAWFTSMGVWWFNQDYLIGPEMLGMPVEEWLFFICIPFSCLFTYYCLDKFFNLQWAEKFSKFIVPVLLLCCLGSAIAFHEQIYTLLTALVTAACIIYLHFIARFPSFGKASLVYVVLMAGFIPVNGALTGTGLDSPIVNYNPHEIIGFRVLTIPIEDFFYGYSLILLNVYVFQFWQDRSRSILLKKNGK